jgi:hypothetical protein
MTVKPLSGIAVASVCAVLLWLLFEHIAAPPVPADRAIPAAESFPAPSGRTPTPSPASQIEKAPGGVPSRTAESALEGWVITQTGAPVPGAWVSAYQPDRGARRVMADEAGGFVFSDFPEGHFRVSATARGYNETVSDGVPHGHRGLRLVMLPLSRVTGRVVRADSGLPIGRFDVLYLDTLPETGAQWQEIARAGIDEWQSVVDPNGQFVLPEVESGQPLAVGARAHGFAPAFATLEPLAPGETAAPVTVALPRGLGVEGRVVDASNRPIADVAVHFGDDTRKPVEDVTDPNGQFSITDLVPGPILLTASHSEFVDRTVEVSPGDPPSDIEIVLSRGARIDGTVVMGDQPVPDALVVAGALGRGGFQHSVVTDAAGRFALAGLPPGPAEVFVDLPGDAESEEAPDRLQQRVLLEDGAITRLDFRFPEATGILEGFIRIHGQAPTSATLRGTTIGEGGDSFFSAVSSSDGFYRATGLLPGETWIEVVATTDSGAERRHQFPMTIAAGAVISHDINLAGTGVLTGRVSGVHEGESGEVALFPADVAVDTRDPETLSEVQRFRIARAEVGSDGQFRLDGLDPGAYTLLAVFFRPDAEDGAEVLSSLRVASTPVVVESDRTARVILPLAK